MLDSFALMEGGAAAAGSVVAAPRSSPDVREVWRADYVHPRQEGNVLGPGKTPDCLPQGISQPENRGYGQAQGPTSCSHSHLTSGPMLPFL